MNRTILYLDDEKHNLTAFKASYREYYRIYTATNARDAYEILEKQHIELVLSDQRMPEVDGVEFLTEVHNKYPWTTRMVVTAYSDFEVLTEAVNKGKIYYFIKKPWDTHQLKLILDKAFESIELREKNEKLERENVKAQLVNLKAQMKPHFLFNALGSLHSLVDKDTELARKFVMRLSGLYRHLLDIHKKDMVSIKDELSCVDNYMFLQEVKFGNKLEFKNLLSDELQYKKIVSTSILTLVENSIKHNIISEEQPLKIVIEEKGEFLCVRNNYNPRIDVDSTGVGLSNLTSRCRLLCGREPEIYKDAEKFEVRVPYVDNVYMDY